MQSGEINELIAILANTLRRPLKTLSPAFERGADLEKDDTQSTNELYSGRTRKAPEARRVARRLCSGRTERFVEWRRESRQQH